MSLSPLDSFHSRFVTYLLNCPRISKKIKFKKRGDWRVMLNVWRRCTVKCVPNIRLEISRVEHFKDLSVDGRMGIKELIREVGLSSSGLRTAEGSGKLKMELHVP
jgi:hypothetical protein